jgi:hypothetical protein
MAGSETIYRVWIISLIFYKHVWQAEKSYIIVLQSMRDVTKRDKVARYLWGRKEKMFKTSGVVERVGGKFDSTSFLIPRSWNRQVLE